MSKDEHCFTFPSCKIDWWESEDIMHHRLFSSPLNNPTSITSEPDRSMIACVHELKIISFESEAWIKTALCKDCEPSFDEYLKLNYGCKQWKN